MKRNFPFINPPGLKETPELVNLTNMFHDE